MDSCGVFVSPGQIPSSGLARLFSFCLDKNYILEYRIHVSAHLKGVFRKTMPAGGAGERFPWAGYDHPATRAIRVDAPATTSRRARSGSLNGSRATGSAQVRPVSRKMSRWSAERRAPYVTGRETPRHGVFGVPRHGASTVRRSAPAPLGAPPPRGATRQASAAAATVARGKRSVAKAFSGKVGTGFPQKMRPRVAV